MVTRLVLAIFGLVAGGVGLFQKQPLASVLTCDPFCTFSQLAGNEIEIKQGIKTASFSNFQVGETGGTLDFDPDLIRVRPFGSFSGGFGLEFTPDPSSNPWGALTDNSKEFAYELHVANDIVIGSGLQLRLGEGGNGGVEAEVGPAIIQATCAFSPIGPSGCFPQAFLPLNPPLTDLSIDNILLGNGERSSQFVANQERIRDLCFRAAISFAVASWTIRTGSNIAVAWVPRPTGSPS